MSYTSGFMLGASIGKSLMNWKNSSKGHIQSAARKVAAPAKAIFTPKAPDDMPAFACVSALPGRRRFRAASLVSNQSLAAMLEEYLPQVKGIIAVVINVNTGSILLTSDDERILDDVEAFLRGKIFSQTKAPVDQAEAEEVTEEEKAECATAMRGVATFLSDVIYKKTNHIFDLRSLLSMIFMVLGIHKIITLRHQFNGPQLLWWGSSLLGRG